MTYDPNRPPSGASSPYGQPVAPGQPGGYPSAPPPKKSKTGIIIGSIVAVVFVIIALCGLGGLALSDSSSDSNADSSPGRSDSPSAPSTTDSRTLVHPAGAPFSFRLPDGFHTVSTAKAKTVGQVTYSSGVAPSTTDLNDLIIVDAYVLTLPAEEVNQDELAAELDKSVKGTGQDPSTRKNVTYNGNKGFLYQFDLGIAKAYSYYLLHGKNEIQVRCQWVKQEAPIKKGCADLLNSLQITG